MAAAGPGRLVILSGPSCVGKSPLRKALAKLYRESWGRLETLVLFNSRAPRPGEREGVDYYFRSRTELEELRSKGPYAVLDVRGDLQAVDIEALKRLLERDAMWLFEWGEPWALDRTGQVVMNNGTPVLITGAYDFESPPPWRLLTWLTTPIVLPPVLPTGLP